MGFELGGGGGGGELGLPPHVFGEHKSGGQAARTRLAVHRTSINIYIYVCFFEAYSLILSPRYDVAACL